MRWVAWRCHCGIWICITILTSPPHRVTSASASSGILRSTYVDTLPLGIPHPWQQSTITELKSRKGKRRERQRTVKKKKKEKRKKADMAANAMQDTLADQPPGPPFASTPLQRLQPRGRCRQEKALDGGKRGREAAVDVESCRPVGSRTVFWIFLLWW